MFLVLAMLPAIVGVFGLPQQIGEERTEPQPVVKKLSRQIATARVWRTEHDALVLDRPGKPLRIELASDTPIFMNGKPIERAALRAGERVRISYDVNNGPARANWVEVLALP